MFTKALEKKKKVATKETYLKLTTLFPQARKLRYLKSGPTSAEVARAGRAMAAKVARPRHACKCGTAVPTLQWWHGHALWHRQPVSLFYPPGQFFRVALPALAVWYCMLYVALPVGLAFFKNRFWASFWAYLQITYKALNKTN